jgi:hypothetical protein
VIVFEVFVNNRRAARAGAKDLGVLSANVTGVGRLGPLSRMKSEGSDLHLHVGGLTSRRKGSDEHLDWHSLIHLKVGDEVRVKLTEAKRADRPTSKRAALPPSHLKRRLAKHSGGRSKTRAAERQS